MMDFLTAEEEFELQYADDLDALSELENKQEATFSVKRPISPQQMETHESETNLQRNKRIKISSQCESAQDAMNKGSHAVIKCSSRDSSKTSFDSLPITRFDGSRAYLRCKGDCDIKITLSDHTVGLLQTSICDLKLKVYQKLELQKNVSNVMSSNRVLKNNEKCELWVEKYKPQSFIELLSDEGVNRTLLRWLKLWDKIVFGREKNISLRKKYSKEKVFFKFRKSVPDLSENMDEHGRPLQKIVLLCGPPGLGKTTLASVIAQFAGYNVVELNASDDRSPEIFRRCLESATQMKSVLDKQNRPNCLVIDEIDGAPIASIKLLVSFAKSSITPKMKQKKGDIPMLLRPVICICNNQYVPALKPLRQVSLILNFPPPSKNRIASRLYEIAMAEGLKTELTPLIVLCEKVHNDIRSCLSTIQFLFNLGKELSVSDVKNMEYGMKDVEKSLFSVWRDVFYAPKFYLFNDVLKTIQTFGDYEKVFPGLFENYIRIKLKSAQEHNIWKGADWLCFADMLQKEIYQHQFFF